MATPGSSGPGTDRDLYARLGFSEPGVTADTSPADADVGIEDGPEIGSAPAPCSDCAPAGRSSESLLSRGRNGSHTFRFDSLIDGGGAGEPSAAPVADDPRNGSPAAGATLTAAIVARGPSPPRRFAAMRTNPNRTGRRELVAVLAATAAVFVVRYYAAGGIARRLPALRHTASAAGMRRPAVRKLRAGMPDPALTPGDASDGRRVEAVTVPASTAATVLRAYGIDPTDTRYMVCRLVPAALGGTNQTSNLFPLTDWFAELKARLDRRLVELVMCGRLPEEAARREIESDWLRAAHRYGVRNYGFRNRSEARSVERDLKWK